MEACARCGLSVVRLTAHRLLGGMLATLLPNRSLAISPALTDIEVEVHPDCCPGGCDSPEDHGGVQ